MAARRGCSNRVASKLEVIIWSHKIRQKQTQKRTLIGVPLCRLARRIQVHKTIGFACTAPNIVTTSIRQQSKGVRLNASRQMFMWAFSSTGRTKRTISINLGNRTSLKKSLKLRTNCTLGPLCKQTLCGSDRCRSDQLGVRGTSS